MRRRCSWKIMHMLGVNEKVYKFTKKDPGASRKMGIYIYIYISIYLSICIYVGVSLCVSWNASNAWNWFHFSFAVVLVLLTQLNEWLFDAKLYSAILEKR